MTWDYFGIDDSIDEYETTIVNDVIGKGRDFEVSRFSHAPHNAPSIYINPATNQVEQVGSIGTSDSTIANYEFYFYSGNVNTLSATTCPLSTSPDLTLWSNNYLAEGFNSKELFYFANSFANSFFKLDSSIYNMQK